MMRCTHRGCHFIFILCKLKLNLLEVSRGATFVVTVAEQIGNEVVSLHTTNADITSYIMGWSCTVYESGHADVLWSSPARTEYSTAETADARDVEQATDIVLRHIDI